jgi:hypothetical protein
MKRLLPHDTCSAALRQRSTIDGTGRSQPPLRHDSTDHQPVEPRRQCALPVDTDPERTAFYAIVSDGTGGVLFVREAPIEIVPFGNTGLVHLTYASGERCGGDIELRLSARTCLDVQQPFTLPDPGTPVIVVGIDRGSAIDAEIIAGMEAEARYRSLILRYQHTRDRRRNTTREPDSDAGQTRSASS